MSFDKVHLRPQLKKRLEALTAEALLPPEELLQEVKRHARVVGLVAKKNPALQTPLADALVVAFSRLLEGVTEQSPVTERQLVQVACRYFVENADSDHDLASATGLEDDAEVLIAVARAVDRSDVAADVSRLVRKEEKL